MTTKKKSLAIKFLDKVIGNEMTFGKNLEAIRLGDDNTQAEFAKRLKISQAHLSQIEKGVKSVSPERAKLFAKKLGYSEITFVELSIQDLLRKSGIKLKVYLEVA